MLLYDAIVASTFFVGAGIDESKSLRYLISFLSSESYEVIVLSQVAIESSGRPKRL